MKIFADLLLRPERTLTDPGLPGRLNPFVAGAALLIMTAADFAAMFNIGNVEGGNPCLWFIIGGMLDLAAIQTLSRVGQWSVLFPIKIAGDIAIIALPAWIALTFFNARRRDALTWAKVYCYLLGVLDVFLVAAMMPAVIGGGAGRPLLAANLLSCLVFAANVLLFTNAYRCCFGVSFDRAIYGWFLPAVAVPAGLIALLFLVIP
jgi:hypothetical protein